MNQIIADTLAQVALAYSNDPVVTAVVIMVSFTMLVKTIEKSLKLFKRIAQKAYRVHYTKRLLQSGVFDYKEVVDESGGTDMKDEK